jgi:hypothetical protein
MRWASIWGADAGMARVYLALLSGCLWVGPAGGPLAYARGSVEVRGEEEESAGAHRFCDLAEGRLPPGGVVRQGAISWVMFSVFCWFCLGLCWVYVGFLDRVPRVMSCVFNHFWVISTIWSFSGLFGPLAGVCHLERWQVLARRRGGSKSKGLVLLDAEQALTLSVYQVVKERMAVMGANLLII